MIEIWESVILENDKINLLFWEMLTMNQNENEKSLWYFTVRQVVSRC